MRAWPLPLFVLSFATAAFAHETGDREIGWTLSPLVIGPLLLVALLYGIGFLRLWNRSGRGRAALRRDGALFALGWLSLTGALISPLHEAGELSFAMHMIEHEIIMLLSALLFVAARPGAAFLWAFPTASRQWLGSAGRWPLWRIVSDPFVATALQALVIIVWHVPWLFDLTLNNAGWHIAQHLSFVASALLFWWAMLYGRTGPLVAAACLFVTSMIGGGLGALMALSGSPWYAGYVALGLTPAGLTPEQDQQLAGLIMWVPGGAWHLAAALFFLSRALRKLEEANA
jgi:cytochrome c oxidase assembly factor CtaG